MEAHEYEHEKSILHQEYGVFLKNCLRTAILASIFFVLVSIMQYIPQQEFGLHERLIIVAGAAVLLWNILSLFVQRARFRRNCKKIGVPPKKITRERM